MEENYIYLKLLRFEMTMFFFFHNTGVTFFPLKKQAYLFLEYV